ncbi:MAG: AAA family ATPase [Moraxellaceae bacterium]|nr:AAA family ATPase [Moraxellaceae bacterium]
MTKAALTGVVSKKAFRLMQKSFAERYPMIQLTGRTLSPGQFHHLNASINALVNGRTMPSEAPMIPLMIRCSSQTFFQWTVELYFDRAQEQQFRKAHPLFYQALILQLKQLHEAINSTCKACGASYGSCEHEGHVIFLDDMTPKQRAMEEKTVLSQRKALAQDEESKADAETNVTEKDMPKNMMQLADPEKLEKARTSMGSSLEKGSQAANFFTKLLSPNGHLRELKTVPDTIEDILTEFLHKFPNFSELHNLLANQFALIRLTNAPLCMPPVLLAGPPGVGKTEALRWLCEKLLMPFEMIDMATAQDVMMLSGSDIRYRHSQPGVPLTTLIEHDCGNPLILLDELDKAFLAKEGLATQPLLTLLERKPAKHFKDLAVRFEVDASYINWFATANDTSLIAVPILSRMTVIDVKEPTREQLVQIAQYIYTDLLVELGCDEVFESNLSKVVIEILVASTPRVMKRVLREALGAAAREKRTQLLPTDIMVPVVERKIPFGFVSKAIH